MRLFGKNPLDDALRAATTFDEAVGALITAYRLEQWIWHPDVGDATFWQTAIAEAGRALVIYRAHGDPPIPPIASAADALRAEGLDMFASAVESGDWHSCLSF
jgi:hypothetical protein